jgi:hypothetical protein
MNTLNVETRLKQAAAVAAPMRSIVDDVMDRLPVAVPKAPPPNRWRQHPVLAASLAALTGIAACLAFIFLLAGPSASFTLADVQVAFEQQRWVHVRYDVGQIKENWINLQTGESCATRYDGGVVYINDQSNIRLWHSKDSPSISQDTPAIYPPGQAAPPWSPRNAWEYFVAPLQQAVATKPADGAAPSVVSEKDTINGNPVVRFDEYSPDNLGRRFLCTQFWADPRTHLPVRTKTRLQLGEREQAGKEWSTGDYDFPQSGPADLFALGVPRGTPIKVDVTTAPADVRPILDAINRNRESFLKQYRAIVIARQPGGVFPLNSVDIIWRSGDMVRDNRHLDGLEQQPEITATAIFAWSAKHEPSQIELVTNEHVYSWVSATVARGSRPRVYVMRLPRPSETLILPTQDWPETIQWPTYLAGVDFQLLDLNPNTPAGCIGFRDGNADNYRSDYYVDPRNDYVCVKQIGWRRRGEIWFKQRETTLGDLHRVANHVVAGTQRNDDYGDPKKNTSPSTWIATIDLMPVQPADYPPAIFDPDSLTKGATVEGY